MARRGGGGRRLKQKRRLADRDILYGRNAVAEALRGRRAFHRMIVREGFDRRDRVGALVESAETRGVPVTTAEARALDDLAGSSHHQGVVLETGPFPYVGLDDVLRDADGRTILLLDRLQDPQNLATLLRTAAAVDVAGVVVQTDRSASITPAVVHSSAGVVEHVPVARVTNSGRAIQDCKDAGYWAIALEATDQALDLFSADLPQPAVLIVGSEGAGVSVPALRAADVVVRLPMPGGVESLNAAVAGSIALYELLRRDPRGRERTTGQH
jgi:23S rRNA (guanosine2251-2'-O)-methyltransferase